jgi:hypothetical protein
MTNIGAKARARAQAAAQIQSAILRDERCPDCWALPNEHHRQVQRPDADNYGDPCDNPFHK